MAIDPPNAWDRPANDLRESRALAARVRNSLESLHRSDDSRRVVREQIDRLERLEDQLSDIRVDINDIGDEQKNRVLQVIQNYEAKLEAHEARLKRRNSEIKSLQRQLSDLKSGRTPLPSPPRPQDPPRPSPPPPSPPRRVIPTVIRRDWLRRLEVLDDSSSYQIAIINSDIQEVRRLIGRSGQAPTSALHVAALFGEVEIADLLLKDRSSSINVNQTITIARLNPDPREDQRHSYGVTPMHIAIGAHQHDMIRFLSNNGAVLYKPSNTQKNQPVAPPRYLLLEGWLEMIGCRDPMDVVRTVDLLLSLPVRWNINSPLDAKTKTLLDFAMELERTTPAFKSTVVSELKNRGATL